MMLGDPNPGTAATATLDTLFRRMATRTPHAIALADPPNREDFTDGPPRRFTYAETDGFISAIASQLRKLGLHTDAIVGIQLPNTAESVLTLLGVLRAGMIAAPLPLLWRRADAAAALGALGARVIVTTSRIDGFDACTTAMDVAADVFPIRHVCAFGQNLPDGVIALDGLLHQTQYEPGPRIERPDNPAAQVALVTFDVTPDGLIPMARSHSELIAGGVATLLEGGIEPNANILGCCATSSFAGLALTMMPWLLSGGALLLHHGFDADAFAAQCREDRCDTVVIPGPLVPQLLEAGLLSHAALKNVLAVWRAPERFMSSPTWRHAHATLTDMLVFGETALIGSRRDDHGLPTSLSSTAAMSPRGMASAVLVAEIGRTPAGTLALRGPMVPRHPFPPGVQRSNMPHLKADAEGFVDTFYPCRLDRMTGTVTLTGPPPGMVSVGGYRFLLNELEELVQGANDGAFVVALPDALAGHRLAGISSGGDVRAALAELGVNPLLVDAFRAA